MSCGSLGAGRHDGFLGGGGRILLATAVVVNDPLNSQSRRGLLDPVFVKGFDKGGPN